MEVQSAIKSALDTWHRERAIEKITLRVKKISKQTGLTSQQLKIRKMEKRWGSCTETNNIILNTEVVKLPFTLIDYAILHELCHTRVKKTIPKNFGRSFSGTYLIGRSWMRGWRG